MRETNPLLGFSIVKEKSYKNDCKRYKHMNKRILNTELKIVGNPEKSRLLHGPLSKRCKGLLHAYVDENMRILYKPDYKHKIIYLRNFWLHTRMEQRCN